MQKEPQTPEPYSFSATQNVLNVGASPQEVLQAQRESANQTTQNVAERAEILNKVAMHQVEQQAQGFVEDAMSNLDLLRAQVAEANARGDQLRTALEATQADLTVCQAELTRVQAKLHQVQFQLSQQKIFVSGKGARDSAAPIGCSQRHGCQSGCFSSCSCIFCRPELYQSSIEFACTYRVSP